MSKKDFLAKLAVLAKDPVHGYKANMVYDLPEQIDNKKPILKGYCTKHQVQFETNARHIFNRSAKLHQKSCPHCDFERGFLKEQPWSTYRVAELLKTHALPWRIDTRNHVIDYLPLTNKTKIQLVCLKESQSGGSCDHIVKHAIRNIQTLINNSQHIVCQGSCDSRLKGKSSRKSIEDLNQHLAARNSQWRVSEHEHYRDYSSEVIATNQSSQITILIRASTIAQIEPICPLKGNIVGKLKLAKPAVDAQRIIKNITDGHLRFTTVNFQRFSYQRQYFFECTRTGHVFEGSLDKVKQLDDHGCQVCKDKKATAIDQDRFSAWKAKAQEQGLTVLDEIWGGAEQPLKMRCNTCDHYFNRRPEDISRFSGCPECRRKVGERAVRGCLSALFKIEFKPHRIQVDSKRYEIDGIATLANGKLLAVEYHGEQHRDPNHILWREGRAGLDGWRKQQNADAVKSTWCADNGVQLLIIWHNDFYKIHSDKKLAFITGELDKLGIDGYDINTSQIRSWHLLQVI
jgi:hypothetical protein